MAAWWVAAALLVCAWRAADACSCASLLHPQTHYCKSDFVIVGRVQKLFHSNEVFDIYKMKIRNIFKATPKAEVALKTGRIFTASHESLCGVTLQPRETYILTGYIQHLQAHLNLCSSYYTKWREVSPRQRKGFRLLYKQGCTCKVNMRMRSASPNTCVASFDECYERHGICLHDRNGRCNWTRAPRLTRCLQAKRFNGTMT